MTFTRKIQLHERFSILVKKIPILGKHIYYYICYI
jgi:hypothetical protein